MLGAGEVLRLVREGRLTTRTELARETELSRSTLSDRIQSLLALDLVREVDGGPSTGGRPPATLCFNRAAGVVLAADVDEYRCRVAVCNLDATPLAEDAFEVDITRSPEEILGAIDACGARLLAAAGVLEARLMGIGVAVPAPVDTARGEPVEPRSMPAWDGFSIPSWFARSRALPVLADKHANVMALGEHFAHWRDVDHLLYVAIARTIDCGIIRERRVHHGASGGAGDIGHIRVAGHEHVLCRCGNAGCLEAVAGEVIAHARADDPGSLPALRDVGRAIGEVLAECINFFNPDVVVVGGEAHQQLLGGVREVALARSMPTATRHLRIGRGKLGPRAGVIGAAVMVIEHVLDPRSVDRAVQELA